MLGIGAEEFQELVQSAVTAVSILGGAMAYMSGYRAAWALIENHTPDTLAHTVNVGLAEGFIAGVPLAFGVTILEIWI